MNKILAITILSLILLLMPLQFVNTTGVKGADYKDLYIEITNIPSGLTQQTLGQKFYNLESENGQNKYSKDEAIYMCPGIGFKVYINAECSASTGDWPCPPDGEKKYWKHDFGFITSDSTTLDKSYGWEYNGNQYDEAWSNQISIDYINTDLGRNVWTWMKIYEQDCAVDCENASNEAYFTVKKYECCQDADCDAGNVCDASYNTCVEKPDLEITKLELNNSPSSITVQNGSSLEISGTVKNSGGSTADASTVNFFYNSADNAPDKLNTTAIPLTDTKGVPIDSLDSGGVAKFSVNWTTPATTGVYYLWAWVDMPSDMKTDETDYPGAIVESDGVNNLMKFGGTLTLTAPPLVDLIIESVNLPQNLNYIVGDKFTPIVTIKNIGTKSAKAGGLVSWSNSCGTNSLATTLPALAVNQTTTVSPSTPININTAGDCKLNILINGIRDTDNILENNLGNNSYDLDYLAKSSLACEGESCELDCSKSFCDATQIMLTLIKLEKNGYFPTDESQTLKFKVWASYDQIELPSVNYYSKDGKQVTLIESLDSDLFIKRFMDVYGGANTKGSLFTSSEAAGNNRDFAENYFIVSGDKRETEGGTPDGIIMSFNSSGSINVDSEAFSKLYFTNLEGLCSISVRKIEQSETNRTDKAYSIYVNCDDSYLKPNFPYLRMPLDLSLTSSGAMKNTGIRFEPQDTKEGYNNNILLHKVFNNPVSTIQQFVSASGYGAINIRASSPKTDGATENEMLLQVGNNPAIAKNIFVEHTSTKRETLGNFYEDMFNITNKTSPYTQKSKVYYDKDGNMHIANAR